MRMISARVTVALLFVVTMLSFGMCMPPQGQDDMHMRMDLAEDQQVVAEDEQLVDSEPTMIEQEDQETGDDFKVEAQLAIAASCITLKLNRGQTDYYSLAGYYYKLSYGMIRNKPIYYNSSNRRIIYYTGSQWAITKESYIASILLNGSTPVCYRSRNTTGGVKSSFTLSCGRRVSIWDPRYRHY